MELGILQRCIFGEPGRILGFVGEKSWPKEIHNFGWCGGVLPEFVEEEGEGSVATETSVKGLRDVRVYSVKGFHR